MTILLGTFLGWGDAVGNASDPPSTRYPTSATKRATFFFVSFGRKTGGLGPCTSKDHLQNYIPLQRTFNIYKEFFLSIKVLTLNKFKHMLSVLLNILPRSIEPPACVGPSISPR